ncbi:DUF6397 family protein [Streptomyces sp. TRM 70361]|uniref:DUF6397 family protein n=1 Tax=Streptomyces sp. TRM 70361 TaxID=3116553 RepID=UPI002E7B17D4|nr:DUF6397 family protein [Streptomyces sp. TRM 70361]MEE1940719.1 DUF6397 family protein [Streptomyces sp. TRM 70361]
MSMGPAGVDTAEAARAAVDAVSPGDSVSLVEARRGLELRPRELELAVRLGEVATVPAAVPGRERPGRRVPVAELARLRAEEGFPATLRARLRLVGAREGAGLLGVCPARFTRLARAGCFGPVRFSLNRYRRVVWFYRAAELRDVAEQQPELLGGALPEGLRLLLAEGADWRPRHWRSRRVAQVLRTADGPWEAAAAHAAVLPPEVLAEAVPDPAERLRLARLRPDLAPTRPDSPAAREVVRGLLVTRDEEETVWHRLVLELALDTARSVCPLPRPPDGAASAVRLPEQALLHHGDDQPAPAVVELASGEPAGTGRDG